MIYRNLDLGTTGQVITGNPTQIKAMIISNRHATAERFLKIYDKATAPTQADTPVMTIPIPPAATGMNVIVFDDFAVGIALRATTGIADNDTGAPGTNEVVVNLVVHR